MARSVNDLFFLHTQPCQKMIWQCHIFLRMELSDQQKNPLQQPLFVTSINVYVSQFPTCMGGEGLWILSKADPKLSGMVGVDLP